MLPDTIHMVSQQQDVGFKAYVRATGSSRVLCINAAVHEHICLLHGCAGAMSVQQRERAMMTIMQGGMRVTAANKQAWIVICQCPLTLVCLASMLHLCWVSVQA